VIVIGLDYMNCGSAYDSVALCYIIAASICPYIEISEECVIVGRSKDSHTADGAEGPGAGAGSSAAADYGTAGKDWQH